MTSPELASQDGGLERAGQLSVIQEFWRADAAHLNVVSGTADERLARSMYVVDLLAMVDWENGGRKEAYRVKEWTRRLNDLYGGGLRDASYRLGGATAPGIDYTAEDWRHYSRTQLYPHVMHAADRKPPATHFELMQALHDGSAKFDYDI